jgi:hypothetical protein
MPSHRSVVLALAAPSEYAARGLTYPGRRGLVVSTVGIEPARGTMFRMDFAEAMP